MIEVSNSAAEAGFISLQAMAPGIVEQGIGLGGIR